MKVYDVMEIASQMRPGNDFDTELVERWIAEVDASIQIEVAKKQPHEIRKIKPDLWESNKEYKKGERASLTDGGKILVYRAKDDVKSEFRPSEAGGADKWEEDAYDTYVSHPHDKLYYLYVICMMDFANREFDKYANDVKVYSEALNEFAKYWQRNYRYSWEDGKDEYETEVRPPR
jgi:hypothetical protein